MSHDVYITRTSSFLPLAPVDNDHMEDVLGMTGPAPSRARRVTLRSNGIRSRHYVIDPVTKQPRYTNAQLAAEAVRLLASGDAENANAAFKLSDLACLSAGTSIADQLLPGHGVMVHGELGPASAHAAPACEVVTTAGVCCAGATALKYAWLAVRAGDQPNAVATASETASLVFRAARYAAETAAHADALETRPELAFEKDFLRWMLSDGAGAFLLEPAPRPRADGAPNLRIDWIDMQSRAHEMPVCMYAGADKNADGTLTSWLLRDHDELGRDSTLAIKQDVRLLNGNVAAYCLEKPFSPIIARRGLSAAAIDWFLPHMSSEYFRAQIDSTLARLNFEIPPERWFTNLATKGNTGAASMYIMLDEHLRSGRVRPGQRILCFVPESGRFSSAFIHLTAV